jgi:anti-sigma B factor antagonist
MMSPPRRAVAAIKAQAIGVLLNQCVVCVQENILQHFAAWVVFRGMRLIAIAAQVERGFIASRIYPEVGDPEALYLQEDWSSEQELKSNIRSSCFTERLRSALRRFRGSSGSQRKDLQLHQRDKEGIRILDLRGHLIRGDSEAILRTAIVALAEARAVNIILNLAGVTEIDADGLGALVFCYARIVRSGGALKLLNLSPLHLSLMVLTRLDTVFEVFTDEQDAVNSFFPHRAVRHYDILDWVQQEMRPAPDLPK